MPSFYFYLSEGRELFLHHRPPPSALLFSHYLLARIINQLGNRRIPRRRTAAERGRRGRPLPLVKMLCVSEAPG